ncbi:MAG TPA: PEP-CTERM sorting domain-containing protein, partial [Phycisphaerae bacterium]
MALIAALASAAAHGTTFLLSLDAASQPAEYNIDAGSNGREQIYLLQQSGSGIGFYFSVDRVAVGMPNTAVFQESAPPNESAAADIYQAGFGTNTLYRQETALGLHPGFFGDDIDAMQIVPDPPGPPLPDVVVVNAGFPYSSLWRNSSLIGQPATINGAMPMADPDGLTPDDIVLSLGAMNLLFASGVTHMGLMAGDDLDALMLLDVTPDPNAPGGFDEVPNGIVDPGLDLAIFSLDPFSPSTFTSGLGGTRSPADLLITSFNGNYGVFRTAAQIGLLTDDNVDALSMAAVPEPGSLLILTGSAVFLMSRRRRPDECRAKALRRKGLARGPAGLRLNVCAACVGILVGVCPALARPGDSDGDNDIDLVDIAAFANAFSGPGGIIAAGGEIMDFDADGDVDLLDFAELREEMDGAVALGNPCAALGPAVVWGGISPPVANSVATLEFKYGTNPDVFCFVLSATDPAPGINLPGPGHIAMPEQQADEVVVVPGAGTAPTRIVFSHIYIVPQGDVGAGSTITINGDLLLTPYDRGVLDVQIQPAGGGAPTTVRYLIRPLLDLDVDSDNNSTLLDRAPQRDGNEETIEDDPTMIGVIVCVNDNDNDGDGVVDFGDGFDLDANNPDDDANPDEVDFVKMVLAIGQHIDTSVASIRVTYSASDPAQAMIAGTPPVITPAPGRLRIWTQRGSAMRDKASIDNGGDYVSPGIHDASDFDFQLDAAAGQRKVELWLEGIRPSPSEGVDRIEFAIDPDGPGPQDFVGKDAVRSTVVSIKFIEAEEVAGTSILPLFNPNPIVTLDAIANPGNAEMVNINVTGTVKDYVAPVEKVRVNGAEVNVTQTSSGPDNLGPFEGNFTAPLMLTGNTTLVEATAINSLNNVGKDSTLIAVMRDANFNITARTVSENPSVPAAPANEVAFLDSYRFRIEVRNLNPVNNQLDVQFDTGVEVKTVTLSRPGNTGPLQSNNLFLVPENLMLPGSASADVQKTRIKADLGQRPKAIYTSGTATCCAVGVTKGILIRKKTDEAIADFIESA